MSNTGLLISASCLVTLVAVSAVGDDGTVPDSLDKTSAQTLSGGPGDPDPALPHRLARQLGSRQLVAAFYRGERGQRLSALDAASSTTLTEPFAVLPSLAALMGAKDRQVASRATLALYTILRHESEKANGFAEVVPLQLAQLRKQLTPLALDRRLNSDVRGVALMAVALLDRKTHQKDQAWLGDLLDDDDISIRRAAITTLQPPLDEKILKTLATITKDDTDLGTRGYAMAMVCENALAHGVEEPSKDLVNLLRTTLQNVKIPVDTLGGVLACVSHFKGDRRADLIDLAIAHPHPAVGEYWKSQKGR